MFCCCDDARTPRFPRAGGRPGLTLLEVMIAIAIIAILAATVAPNFIGALDRKRVDASAEALVEIMEAMTTMRLDNQDWPGSISHMAEPITTSMTNVCGNGYPTGKVNNWEGPYLDRPIPASGLPIGVGIAEDVFVREVVSGNDAYLKIQITDVSEEDAIALNHVLDADSSATGGAFRWNTPADAEGMVTAFYLRPIRGC